MAWIPVLVTMVICYVSLSGAEISITAAGALDDKGNLKCSSKVTLMCTIQEYDGNMEWKVDSNLLMSCVSGACSTIPHQNYAFSFKGVSGQFNITINPVMFADNGLTFECSKGNESQTFTTTVNVLPDKTTTSLTVNNNTNATDSLEVKATTGCVYPTDDIQFEWFYYKEGEDPVPFTFGNQNSGPSNQSTADCTVGDCGGDDVKQMESSLTFEQGTEGEDFFLQAVVTSSKTTDTIVLTSSASYKLKVPGMSISSVIGGLGTKVGLVVTLALIGILVVVVTIIIFVVLVYKGKNDPEKQRIVGH